MSNNKPRIIKDYIKLDKSIVEQIKLQYPYGFEDHLIIFVNAQGKNVSALPFETEDKYYLVRMTAEEAIEFIEEDDDYDDDGNLVDDVREEFEDKYEDTEDETES
ncbi:hypothetical protein DNU06_03045 [Putridiphycobacter roseus]|uniref:Uncharacterized protein n=1 Tax=Putridiphycobacter roseus TaxID=2219161 RepID=A0A2W1NIG8_9FLAO|nr:hypothetical protein [Putridiphycobacter roseus]PZE18823.1 hypothetical protein DNU06_03045 [Putridiphycobacter roseus]